MNQRIGPKQIRCQFTLDVDENPAHDYALVVLKQWLAQQEHDPKVVSQFNRQIYLSGLFLHLHSPKLPSALADSFGPTSAGLETLCQHLQLTPESSNGEPVSSALMAKLAEQQQSQSHQLTALCNTVNELRDNATRPAAPADTHADEHLIAANQILTEQKQLQAQLRALSEQLASLSMPNVGQTSTAPIANTDVHRNNISEDQATVAEAIAKVASVKAKGLW